MTQPVQRQHPQPLRQSKAWRHLGTFLMIVGLLLMSVPFVQKGMAVWSQKQLWRQFAAASSEQTEAWHRWLAERGAHVSPAGTAEEDTGAGSPSETLDESNPPVSTWERIRANFWEDPALAPFAEGSHSGIPAQPDPAVLGDFPGARLRIPSIDVDAIVLYGTTRRVLTQGPGFYEIGALPGEEGHVAIAAHRTTYGAWFRRLDELQPGDLIYLEFLGRTYRYAVEKVWVIAHNDWSVVAPTQQSILTLTTCHPPGSASHRLAVRAKALT